ncbi:MAG: peptidylprolyl isomerase [Thermodesulfobacteriota bacterium]|nr:peptidylprolyl isomerase [Thermodesulfobacteriota bacterium]
MKLYNFKTVLLVTLCLTFFYAIPGFAEKNGAAARVNDVEISRVAFNEAVSAAKDQFAAIGVDKEKKSATVDIEQEVIDRFITIELMFQDAKKRGIQADDAKVDQEMLNFRASFKTEEEFNAFQKKNSLDMTIVKEQFSKKSILQQFHRELLQELKKKIEISPEESEAFYKANIEKFAIPVQVKASHILIKLDKDADEAAEKQALKSIEDIHKKALDGEDFAELAEKNSQGPSSSRGGDLGFFSKKQMVKPFADAAFALKPGEISEVVKTSFGYHIIKLMERKDAGTTPYEDVKDKINDYLMQAELDQVQREYNLLLRENAQVEVTI